MSKFKYIYINIYMSVALIKLNAIDAVILLSNYKIELWFQLYLIFECIIKSLGFFINDYKQSFNNVPYIYKCFFIVLIFEFSLNSFINGVLLYYFYDNSYILSYQLKERYNLTI